MSQESGGLNIAVLVKQVPDVNAITVDPGSHKAVLGSERVMNTYDAYAIGESLSIRERVGGKITVITAGPPEAKDVLLRALATGADEAVLVHLPRHNDIDTLAIARILASEIAARNVDLVLAGQSTDDYESGQVGPQVAESLAWPHVSLVTHVDVEGATLRVRKDAEAAKETIEVPLPAVLMVLSGREGPQRFPTLRGMMAAKKKTIAEVEGSPPDSGSRLEWQVPKAVEREAEGIVIQGQPVEQAVGELVRWLKEQKLA
jgi:electron transfer flavoprotein beta subunit